jgi:biotin synthase
MKDNSSNLSNTLSAASNAKAANQKVTRDQITAWFELPFMDLVLEAQRVHRGHFAANQVQVSTLLSIKTGCCPEVCDYCSQSAHFDTDLEPVKREPVEQVLQKAREAKDAGSTRFCMGAAWRDPHTRDMPYVESLIKGVKDLGLETCMTLGKLDQSKADQLQAAGLDYYNHNIDTSPEFYAQVVHTRDFSERIETLDHVRASGMKMCSGGILGMGETRQDRVGFLYALSELSAPPESVPINRLVPIAGTPLGDAAAKGELAKLDTLEWIRTIAVARLCFPSSYIRLSAGRESLSDAEQALAFMAGANSFFYGDRLLTSANRAVNSDKQLLESLGMQAEGLMQAAGDQSDGQDPNQKLGVDQPQPAKTIHCVQA